MKNLICDIWEALRVVIGGIIAVLVIVFFWAIKICIFIGCWVLVISPILALMIGLVLVFLKLGAI